MTGAIGSSVSAVVGVSGTRSLGQACSRDERTLMGWASRI